MKHIIMSLWILLVALGCTSESNNDSMYYPAPDPKYRFTCQRVGEMHYRGFMRCENKEVVCYRDAGASFSCVRK